ncbi:hypothetical protein SCUCBS95973_007840 [Sporothrix curviconia]|uniref:Protein kinase domain-containing protein n=1 Tax=Sporothrix curviconia TaxID=1260050 RepID=A0ABP0CHE0_9PEZI
MAPSLHPIYPDWPSSPADLVPLPMIEGPKLKPFDFGGPQEIEFLEFISGGVHSHVLRVRIHGQEYALKVFRYVCSESWYGMRFCYNPDTDYKEELAAFAPYSEPFYAECRAFGRLQETGRTDLAIDCFGYVLLNEASERALHDLKVLEFDGDNNYCADDCRNLFAGLSGRPPPLRGILKTLGRPNDHREKLSTVTARRLLDDIMQMQQLGIINLDVRHWQCIDGKHADFSTAMTTPHCLTSPEVLAGKLAIPPAALAAVEYQLFTYCISDYWAFQEMVKESNRHLWMKKHPELFSPYILDGLQQQRRVELLPISGHRRYELRRTPRHRTVPYTLVDPRRFDWRAPRAAAAAAGLAKRPTTSVRYRAARMPRWYYPCHESAQRHLWEQCEYTDYIDFAERDGQIFPTWRRHSDICAKLTKLLKSNGGKLDMTVPENKELVEMDEWARFVHDEEFIAPSRVY